MLSADGPRHQRQTDRNRLTADGWSPQACSTKTLSDPLGGLKFPQLNTLGSLPRLRGSEKQIGGFGFQQGSGPWDYTHTHTHIYIYTCIYIHIYIYVYICVYTEFVVCVFSFFGFKAGVPKITSVFSLQGTLKRHLQHVADSQAESSSRRRPMHGGDAQRERGESARRAEVVVGRLVGVGWGWLGLVGVGWGWLGLVGVGWGWLGLVGVGWGWLGLVADMGCRWRAMDTTNQGTSGPC